MFFVGSRPHYLECDRHFRGCCFWRRGGGEDLWRAVARVGVPERTSVCDDRRSVGSGCAPGVSASRKGILCLPLDLSGEPRAKAVPTSTASAVFFCLGRILGSRQKVVATLPRYTQTLPASGLDELTEKERQTLDAWLGAKREQAQTSNRRYMAGNASSWLAGVSAAITAGEADMTPEKALAIWKGLSDVAKALKKAGHPKPKATPRLKPSADKAKTVTTKTAPKPRTSRAAPKGKGDKTASAKA